MALLIVQFKGRQNGKGDEMTDCGTKLRKAGEK